MPRFSPPAPSPVTARLVTRAESGMVTGGVARAAHRLREEPDLLRAVLRALVNDGAELRTVSARSAVHPNGFAKVVLHAGERWGIRLHVWPPGRLVEDVNPHGHRWEFASWIVTGTLREVTFTESPRGEWFERCEYGRRPSGKAYLRVTGSARLTPRRTIHRPAGMVYVRSRSVLHTAEPHGGGLVASLVLQGSKSFGPTPVYLRPGDPAEDDERELRPDELRSLLTAVIAAIP